MYTEKVSEVMHLLIAVHLQGEKFYLSQIDEILNHYGRDTVLLAENNLYKTKIFEILNQ